MYVGDHRGHVASATKRLGSQDRMKNWKQNGFELSWMSISGSGARPQRPLELTGQFSGAACENSTSRERVNSAFVSSVVKAAALQPENSTKNPPALGVAADGRKVSLSPESQK
jgi:hypothetical protein